MSDIETHSVSIGGPTFFLQAPDGFWGEFELPEGVRIENGDGFNLYQCKFLGILYREVRSPKRPKDLTPEAAVSSLAREEHDEAMKEWRRYAEEWQVILEREDIRITMSHGMIPSFITLLPLDQDGK